MQTLLLPATRSGGAPPPLPMISPVVAKRIPLNILRPLISPIPITLPHSLTSSQAQRFLSPPYSSLIYTRSRTLAAAGPVSATFVSPSEESEKAKLAQVSKRLESTSRYFKRLGSIGFWGQLVCTVVAAGILSFSVVITGKITSPFTFYSTAAGIAAAFLSVFWSFGYLRLSAKLKKTASEPSKAPPRADVVKSLKNGIALNLVGMGAAVVGLQATVGWLSAKALTTSSVPYYQGISPGSSPVLALDVILVQASANTILSHFLGLLFSLELLRSVTLPPPSESIPVPVPKVA
ncbi:PREDICTED: protein TIC 21, chloroplastic-like [Ipomoea nil]|uniref:protein TIC 21, chloroplastic-like n=1 Tax=Ipomoea nil TaxID=35883 RepID=UPI0009013B77|nr:PREDICTED: protein TIC 21, chloroplastic-like [Ipomoea nil]